MRFNNATIKDGGGWLEAGEHDVVLYDFKFDKSVTGKEIIKVTFKGNMGNFIDDFYLTDKAQWRLKDLSLACGISNDGEWEMKHLVGKSLKIHLKYEAYKNRDGEEKQITKCWKFSPSLVQNGDEYILTKGDPF